MKLTLAFMNATAKAATDYYIVRFKHANFVWLASLIFIMSSMMSFSYSVHAQEYGVSYEYGSSYENPRSASYRYTYYPRHQVYRADDSGLWFWRTGSRWHSGVRLPLNLRIDTPGLHINLGSALPYQHHSYVVRRWPSVIVTEEVVPVESRPIYYYPKRSKYKKHYEHDDDDDDDDDRHRRRYYRR